ncbi:transmembrane protein 192-like [Ostrea edulis]|uniref:transmembrane protein 192-like n=1 Tax=Ostrea edulis TaxID=37623 RepID=UPI002094A055|nr:transmembrane protein 192-like [Ostrea edulis]
MVSLGSDSRQTGGYFFHDHGSVQDSDRDELLSEAPSLSDTIDPPYRKIHTTWTAGLEIVVIVVAEVCMFVVPLQGICNKSVCANLSFVCYTHGGLWFLMLLFDFIYQIQHSRNRKLGYLEFYRKTRNIRRMPLLINSGANALLVIVVCLRLDSVTSNTDQRLALQIGISLEMVAILVFLIWYLVLSITFNNRQAGPDVVREDLMNSFMQTSVSSEIGYKDDSYSDQVLERQADMIRYLKQHNAQLGKRLLVLTEENNMLKSNR